MLLSNWTLHAQTSKKTLQEILNSDSRNVAGLNNKRSSVNGDPVVYYGIYAGQEFDQVLKIQLSYYWLQHPVYENFPNSINGESLRTSLNYMSLGLSYQYYEHGYWSLLAPVEIGLGRLKNSTTDSSGHQISKTKHWSVPLEIGTQAYYAVFPWLKIKTGLGLRLSLGKESFSNFTAPYFQVGLSLYPKPIIDRLRQEP